jgi:hypothetical protein
MERVPQPKARLVVNVMEHGTIVGTDEGGSLEFDDCVGAVEGLVGWLADVLAEANDATREEIGAAIFVDALHRWTFDEHVDDSNGCDDLPEADRPQDRFPTN